MISLEILIGCYLFGLSILMTISMYFLGINRKHVAEEVGSDLLEFLIRLLICFLSWVLYPLYILMLVPCLVLFILCSCFVCTILTILQMLFVEKIEDEVSDD